MLTSVNHQRIDAKCDAPHIVGGGGRVRFDRRVPADKFKDRSGNGTSTSLVTKPLSASVRGKFGLNGAGSGGATLTADTASQQSAVLTWGPINRLKPGVSTGQPERREYSGVN
jgi:hypothetical protein